ncbi:cytochrome oxidase Cu insertion factor (SCO1/SenC/PrrC family) [Bradyrhizobium elkanii]|uniref:hypothetical protein n=1 Tax=Bradyrhizobium TaxID=374 RepID=UPI00216A73B9|nr:MULTISPECIES: hypothetical protein [Bradyrhizobium]MCS3928971.1 cytochrome oxidase Cu insertion factor (SCO1/SenC/PrrC family) [Bradyrhizobium elkanii]MCS3969527.1 cytochrome oxidase Cu insertion factor (SCO1/SenC/PrrC family) [Bradyrhizobium japonicum]
MNTEKPYPVLVIAAFVCFAIVLMLLALIGTNGPASVDAAKKAPQTTGMAVPRVSDEKAVPVPTTPSIDIAGDSDLAAQGRANKIRSSR